MGRKTNRKLSKKATMFISRKISKLRHEGKDEDQAIAIAYSLARKKGYKIPKRKGK